MSDKKEFDLTNCTLRTFTKGLRHPLRSRGNPKKVPSFCDLPSNDSSFVDVLCSTAISHTHTNEELTNSTLYSPLEDEAKEKDAFDASMNPAVLEDSIRNHTEREPHHGLLNASVPRMTKRDGTEAKPLAKITAPCHVNDKGERSGSTASEVIPFNFQPPTKRYNLRTTKVAVQTNKKESPAKSHFLTKTPILRKTKKKVEKEEIKKKPFTCATCKKGFKSKGVLKSHLLTIHSTEFPCDQCNQYFPIIYKLNAHKYSHMTWDQLQKSKRYHQMCYFCQKIFLNRVGYEDHIAKHTTEKYHKCQQCSVRLGSSHALRYHSKAFHAAGKKKK